MSVFFRRLFRRSPLFYDVVLVSDLSFPGGTNSSNIQEINIQHRAGLKTAVFFAPATGNRFPQRDGRKKLRKCKMHPGIRSLLDSGYADLRQRNDYVRTPLTVIRHPMVANSSRFLPTNIETDRVVVIINHPAVREGGRVDYELAEIRETTKKVFGKVPEFCPVSPVASEYSMGPMSENVALGDCWWNVFDPVPQKAISRKSGEPIVIGRHSRDNSEKWPDDEATIRKVYPDEPGISVRVLGGAKSPATILGGLPSNWSVSGFDHSGVRDFLQSIDVYVYFHRSSWKETFGRAPCEAMIAGIPTVLPKYLEPTFGDAALYCDPDEVLGVIRRLQNDGEYYIAAANRARSIACERFASSQHLKRLAARGVGVSEKIKRPITSGADGTIERLPRLQLS